MSHVCQGCGWDLASLRPGPDPHYGMTILTCPSCHAHAVRVRDPIIPGWRRLRVRIAATFMLALHAAVLIPCAGAFTAVLGSMVDRPYVHRSVREQTEIAVVGALVTLIAGLWIGVTLARHPRLIRLSVWIGFQGLVAAFLVLMFLMALALKRSYTINESFPLDIPGILAQIGIAIVLSTACFFAVEPVALFIRFLGRVLASALFRWRRARRRAQRN